MLLGLLQLAESTLLLLFSGSKTVALLLAFAAFFVLAGSLLWPRKLPPPVAGAVPAADPVDTEDPPGLDRPA